MASQNKVSEVLRVCGPSIEDDGNGIAVALDMPGDDLPAVRVCYPVEVVHVLPPAGRGAALQARDL